MPPRKDFGTKAERAKGYMMHAFRTGEPLTTWLKARYEDDVKVRGRMSFSEWFRRRLEDEMLLDKRRNAITTVDRTPATPEVTS